jgi:hypothetical protein
MRLPRSTLLKFWMLRRFGSALDQFRPGHFYPCFHARRFAGHVSLTRKAISIYTPGTWVRLEKPNHSRPGYPQYYDLSESYAMNRRRAAFAMRYVLSFIVFSPVALLVAAQASGTVYPSSDCTSNILATYLGTDFSNVDADECQGFDSANFSFFMRSWITCSSGTPAVNGYEDASCSTYVMQIVSQDPNLKQCYASTGAGLGSLKFYCLGASVPSSSLV